MEITDKNAKGYRPSFCDKGLDPNLCCPHGCAADKELAEMANAGPTCVYCAASIDGSAPAGAVYQVCPHKKEVWVDVSEAAYSTTSWSKRILYPRPAPAAQAAPHWLDSPQASLGGKTAREGYAANPEYASLYPLPTERWTYSPAAVNTLPPGLREYVRDLQTICDPAGIVAENTMLRDQTSMLDAMIGRLKRELEAAKPDQAAVRDAERYRWLRHGDNDELVLQRGPVDPNYVYLPRNAKLDEMIDAQLLPPPTERD